MCCDFCLQPLRFLIRYGFCVFFRLRGLSIFPSITYKTIEKIHLINPYWCVLTYQLNACVSYHRDCLSFSCSSGKLGFRDLQWLISLMIPAPSRSVTERLNVVFKDFIVFYIKTTKSKILIRPGTLGQKSNQVCLWNWCPWHEKV